MTTMVTQNGHNSIREKLHELYHVELPKTAQMLEDTRPMNGADEFPTEYLQAIEAQGRIERKIEDLQNILNDCMIFDKNTMVNKDEFGNNRVGFGATVSLIQLETEKEIQYTLVSSYESDIEKGLMSTIAPFAKEMMGLLEGDEFEMNGKEYVILSIEYVI